MKTNAKHDPKGAPAKPIKRNKNNKLIKLSFVALILNATFLIFNSPKAVAQPTVTCTVGVASYTPATCSTCYDGTVIISASGSCVPYSFSLDGGAFAYGGTFTGLGGGASHTVTVKDCLDSTCGTGGFTSYYGTTGIIKRTAGNNTNLANARPNPTASTTTIEYALPQGTNQGELVFYNTQGSEVKRFKVDDTFSSLLISTTDIPAGIYYYNLQIGGTASGSKKMVVVK